MPEHQCPKRDSGDFYQLQTTSVDFVSQKIKLTSLHFFLKNGISIR